MEPVETETPVDQKVQEEQTSQTFLESLSDFRCPQCAYRTGTRNKLRKHREQRHPEGDFIKCSKCSYKTGTQEHMRKHERRTHPPGDLLKCSKCLYQTTVLRNMRRHEIRVHPEGGFRCSGCQETFPRRNDLREHQRTCALDDRFMEAPGVNLQIEQRALVIRPEIIGWMVYTRRPRGEPLGAPVSNEDDPLRSNLAKGAPS